MYYVAKFFSLSRQNLKKDLMYRADFLFSIAVTPITLMVYYFIWKAVYSSDVGTIAGLDFTGMMSYLIYGQIISIFIFNAAAGHLQQKVQSGKFSEELLKPVHPFTFLFAEAFSARALAFFLEVIPITFIVIFFFHPVLPQGIRIPLFFVSVILAFVINFMLSFIVGLLSFWTVRVEAFHWLAWISFRVFSGEFFPLSLLPAWMQSISHFLPFEYIRYRVALIGFQSDAGAALITIIGQLVWIAILGLIVAWLWRTVIRRLTLAGG